MRISRGWERWQSAPRARDVLGPLVVGALARAAVVIWAVPRFPPAEDGHYYHVLAERLSRSLGYTWLWPTGVVTPAAHYPVGYPAMIGALYAVFGPHPVYAMALNAVLGCLAIVAVHRITATVASRAGALLAALLVALDPGLVLYTPALMTEGVTAALLAVAGWIVVCARGRSPARSLVYATLSGAVVGVATLVRPQSVLFAPVVGGLVLAGCGAFRGRLRRVPPWVLGMVLASGLSVGVTLPWTARNCRQMGECVWVSANGGWNLLIGAGPGATGGYVSLEQAGIPRQCLDVYDEAGKDRCFRDGAVAEIRRAPARWLARVMPKLSATFDYCDAAGWYLNTSNPAAFDGRQKDHVSATEIGWHRGIVLLCLIALARAPGGRRGWRMGIALGSLPWLLLRPGWVAHLGLVLSGLALGRGLFRHPPAALALAAVAETALVHVLFFGASRYALVCHALLGALAGATLLRRPTSGAPSA